MKKVKVVAHVYFAKPYDHIAEHYENYFPIGMISHVRNSGGISGLHDQWQYMHENGVSARTGQSAIIFRPV